MSKNSEQKKRCRICDKRKPLSSFYPCLSANDGLSYKCRPCNANYSKNRVQCSNCNTTVSRTSLADHKKTMKCRDHDKPWKRFKSTGSNKVYCPCRHPMCPPTKLSESTVYRHLKHENYPVKYYGEWKDGKLIHKPVTQTPVEKLRFKMCKDYAELNRKYKHNPIRNASKREALYRIYIDKIMELKGFTRCKDDPTTWILQTAHGYHTVTKQ